MIRTDQLVHLAVAVVPFLLLAVLVQS